MKELIAKYIAVIATSSVKYLFGIFAAIGADLNFIETLVCTVSGGMIGVLVYLYLWDRILWVYHKFFPKKHSDKPISKSKRRILRFVIRYELYGIVLLTPIILSVPVGTILAVTFEHNKWRIKRFMLIGFTAWTVVTYGLYKLLGININELF
jgi:hypothetical protein